MSTTAYLDQLQSLGIGSVELQLPPTLLAADLERWMLLAQEAAARRFRLALHAPLRGDHPAWPQIKQWFSRLARQSPLTLIVHGCAAARPDPALGAETVGYVRSLLSDLPQTSTVAVEQGWNWGATVGPRAALRRAWRRRQKQRSFNQRPAGVGSGLGTQAEYVRSSESDAAPIFDPALQQRWWRRLKHPDGFCGTGTRAETLEVVSEIDQPNCVIAWDLAHDWLGGVWSGTNHWKSIPTAAFLRRVGYVRVHDAAEDGSDHWPLVIGNVPYTTQLRALLHNGFDGTVCVATRYTASTRAFGDRWQVLARSLAVVRQALRLN